MMSATQLYGVGVGPGDPELITLKALRVIKECDVVAYHETQSQTSHALSIAKEWIDEKKQLLPLTYPVTTQKSSFSGEYADLLIGFYEKTTEDIEKIIESGKSVCVLAEGDPLFYSSFMYIFDRLGKKYQTEIIPGISSIFAAAAAFQTPICYRNQSFTVLSGVLSYEDLVTKLHQSESFAILKLGRNLDKVRNAIEQCQLMDRALYIEKATMVEQKIIPLKNVNSEDSPYFSLILIPGKMHKTVETFPHRSDK